MKANVSLTCGLYISMERLAGRLRARAAEQRIRTMEDVDDHEWAVREATVKVLEILADEIVHAINNPV